MVIRTFPVLLVTFCTGLLSSTCKKALICSDQATYSFTADHVKAYPDADSVYVGDTIWIEYYLPVIYTDNFSGKIVNYADAVNFGNNIKVLKFKGGSVSDPGAQYVREKFTYILDKGHSAKSDFPDEGEAYNFSRNSNSFVLRVGIVPKELGTFAITISDAGGVYKKGDPCTKATFAFSFIDTDQHLYLYQANRPGYTISEYEQSHLYCFRVY